MAAVVVARERSVAVRPGNRTRSLATCGLIAAAGLALTGLEIKDTPLALLGMSMAAAGILSSVPVFWGLAGTLYSGSAAVVGFVLINSVGNLGGFASPYGMGLITDATGSQLTGLYALASASNARG